MHFQVEMKENSRKNIFTDNKTTNKVPLVFLDAKVLTEREQLYYWALPTNKQGTVFVFSI